MSNKHKYTSNNSEEKINKLNAGAMFKKYKEDIKKSEGALASEKSNSSLSKQESIKENVKNEIPVVVGKSFAETFSFLKKTDLYELPPQPKPAEAHVAKNSNAIIVNPKQRGNPILKHVHNIPWEYGEIVADYEIGKTACALFLSLRYHNLNPDYIHERLKLLGNRYTLRVLLVQVDVENSKSSLKQMAKIAILANCTLILAWSAEEAGRYLETYKTYENKPADILQERVEQDYLSKMQDVLTTVKSVNKTDVISLLSTFKSLKKVANATIDEIKLSPGFGPQKAQRLYNAIHEPFKRDPKKIILKSPNKQKNVLTEKSPCKLIKPGLTEDLVESCNNSAEDIDLVIETVDNSILNNNANIPQAQPKKYSYESKKTVEIKKIDDVKKTEDIKKTDGVKKTDDTKKMDDVKKMDLLKGNASKITHTTVITDEDYQELVADSDDE